jgi:DNA-binding GntR family transcriptional regulator
VHTGVSDADDAVREHTAVLDAFKVGKPGIASAAMRAHIERVRVRSRSDSQTP